MAFGGASWLTGVDLYDWTGSSWVVIPQTVRPPKPFNSGFPQTIRVYCALAYDARRDKLVLFGSADALLEGGYLNATPTIWEWDSRQGWVSRSVGFPTIFTPSLQMVFDATRGTLIAWMATPARVIRAFEWDGGASWSELLVTPPQTYLFRSLTVGHDPMRGHSYTAFGDTDNNWAMFRLATVAPARFEPHGAGCPGSLGQSQLTLVHPWTRAWIGSTLEMRLSNLPQSAGLVILGFSDQRSGAIPLPAPLDLLGMPGCFARASLDVVCSVSGSGNEASLQVPVPPNPDIVGVPLFAQGCSFDPGFNRLGMTVSNSVRLTAGIR